MPFSIKASQQLHVLSDPWCQIVKGWAGTHVKTQLDVLLFLSQIKEHHLSEGHSSGGQPGLAWLLGVPLSGNSTHLPYTVFLLIDYLTSNFLF